MGKQSSVIHPLACGREIIVDECDKALLGGRHWTATQPDPEVETFYAITSGRSASGGWTAIYMHRLILGAPRGKVVDHVNGNGLDNRRDNIRLCTISQNNANRIGRRPASGFKGVYRTDTAASRWLAQIWFDGTTRRLGVFSDAREAAHAYDEAARKVFGEFARLNFPKDGERNAFEGEV
jgi:hypothetical protein